jgi:hypothetical protein
MKGIITFYINYHPEENQNPKDLVELFKEINKDLLENINKEQKYGIAIIPTTKESCRIDKINFLNNDDDMKTLEEGD